MRFQTIVASFLVLAFASSSSLVAAQNVTVGAGCSDCIVSAIKGINGCQQPDVNPSTDPSKLNPAELQCFCALASDPTWANQCSTTDTCGTTFGSTIAQSMASVKGQYCTGSTTTSSKSSATAVKAVAAVAVAFTAAFAQTLL
ncbi:hypothetical protein BGZ58_010765 [Dissophora ornata]|nr:hypothetical protein BGZ58_010765 [Dissophora ornata]